jgi:hypothetical protein
MTTALVTNELADETIMRAVIDGLKRPHGPAEHGLCNVLGIASVAAPMQTLNEAVCASLIPVGPKQWSKAVEEAVQFGLQCHLMLLIHERSPRDA